MIIPNEITKLILQYLPTCIECSDIIVTDYTFYNDYHTVFTICECCKQKYSLCIKCISHLINYHSIMYPLKCNNCKSSVFIEETF